MAGDGVLSSNILLSLSGLSSHIFLFPLVSLNRFSCHGRMYLYTLLELLFLGPTAGLFQLLGNNNEDFSWFGEATVFFFFLHVSLLTFCLASAHHYVLLAQGTLIQPLFYCRKYYYTNTDVQKIKIFKLKPRF